jgi:hypothetical protein
MRGSGSGALRGEISVRNAARCAQWPAEVGCAAVPTVVYAENGAGEHGNFLRLSYRRILEQPEWRARLAKVYTGSRFLPRSGDRKRGELECANSSDALLMNIFCYPRILKRKPVCSLLGIEPGQTANFGFRPRIPFSNGRGDQSEMDLRLGNLLIEAKLTESDFQSASPALVHRYRDLEAVFDVSRLPTHRGKYRSYQLIRGALAIHVLSGTFAVFCDQRRPDLMDDCFEVMAAVASAELRCRMSLVTWQELAATLPISVRGFLAEKYGVL